MSYTYEFRTTNVLLLLQMVFTAIILHAFRILKVVNFATYSPPIAKKILPVSVFYCLNTAVALAALRELSVPSYTMIKRLAPIFTMGIELIVIGTRVPLSIFAALGTMCVGSGVAYGGDSRSSVFGWALGLLSCCLQALYLTYAKKSGAETGLNAFGVLYYHCMLSTPMLIVAIILLGEYKEALAYTRWTEPGFMVVLFLSIAMGFLLNYSLFLCSEKTSPTSTMVSGHVKAMAQTLIGFFTFGGADTSPQYVLGTLLNIAGGLGYAGIKLKGMLAKEAAEKAAAGMDEETGNGKEEPKEASKS